MTRCPQLNIIFHARCPHALTHAPTHTQPTTHMHTHIHAHLITSTAYTTKSIEIYQKQKNRPKSFTKMYTHTAQMQNKHTSDAKQAHLNMGTLSPLGDIVPPFYPVQCCVCRHLAARSGALSLPHYQVT